MRVVDFAIYADKTRTNYASNKIVEKNFKKGKDFVIFVDLIKHRILQ